MDMLVRGAALYFLVWLLFRLSGRRTTAQMTTFDFVLVLIISEATQEALLDDDSSFTNSAIVILTLIWIDRTLAIAREKWKPLEAILDGVPMIIWRDGRALRERMDREQVDEEDVLHAARHDHGLARLDQVEHAVLEPSGGISVIPRPGTEK